MDLGWFRSIRAFRQTVWHDIFYSPPWTERWSESGERLKTVLENAGSEIRQTIYIYIYTVYISGWWFQTWLLFFPYIGNSTPNWLIFFRGVGIPPTRYQGSHVFFWSLSGNWDKKWETSCWDDPPSIQSGAPLSYVCWFINRTKYREIIYLPFG